MAQAHQLVETVKNAVKKNPTLLVTSKKVCLAKDARTAVRNPQEVQGFQDRLCLPLLCWFR